MDTPNSHGIEAKIQKLQWLLKECIGLEEYELCHQIQTIIQKLHKQTNESNKQSEDENTQS